ncbi:MarR family winged helix-turn-helix transcriptional regulator [Nocardioides sp. Iso805N]|uniref:MarR family winged helix-turn-helix transcriptional regulator n=1 Tax=Nocardioides sp. Iso805N TaxID=1283287 RepID=UPI000375E44B|nr:MarR family transcriptional regulator [Nocardioides sp. Iso805N]
MDDTTGPATSSAAIAGDLRAVVALLVRRTRANPVFPPHQFGVLRAIDRMGPQTASQLAALEFVRPQSMAHTLQQLDEAGFITRHADPTDGRQTLIALSDSGVRALADQRREVTGWLAAEIDQKLDAGERATLAQAVTLLGRIVKG